MIRKIEELSINAFPARDNLLYDGWVIRMSGGSARRVNSVNLLYPSTLPVAEKIEVCEQIFSSKNLKKVFKLTDQETCVGVESLLKDRGYHEEGRTVIMTLDLSGLADTPDSGLEYYNDLPADWYDDLCRSDGRSAEDRSVMEAAWKKVVPPSCYIGLREKGERVAFARGVIDGGFIGLYGIHVDTAVRRRGLGEKLTRSLIAYGRERGCSGAYLQVVAGNEKAIGLYEKIGFREAYRYWYLVKA